MHQLLTILGQRDFHYGALSVSMFSPNVYIYSTLI